MVKTFVNKIIQNEKANYYLRRWLPIFVPSRNKRKILRRQLYSQYTRHIINELVREKFPNDYVFFSRAGVGDVFFAASLMKEFKKIHPGRVVYVTEKESIADFLRSFPSIDEVIYNPYLDGLQAVSYVQRPIATGQLNFLFFPYRGSNPNYVFADSYANLLGMPLNSVRETPILSPEDIQRATQEFSKLHITPQRTFILIPECQMFKSSALTPRFWQTLATNLANRGFDVVFNSRNKAYQHFKTTFLPLNAFVAFASQAKHIFSFRSGINDFMVGMGITHLTAIYPNNMEVTWSDNFLFNETHNKYHIKTKETELDNLMHIYSLSSNFNVNIDEIIYDELSEERLMEALLQRIK